MNVIAFRQRPVVDAWSEAELRLLAETLEIGGRGLRWETGLTETGDAQFYLLGPQPEQACELCVSRIDGRYILEDGNGALLGEHRSLSLIAAQLRDAMRKTRWWPVARVVMLWCAIRHIIQDKFEPLLVEGEELIVHFAPQFAAYV